MSPPRSPAFPRQKAVAKELVAAYQHNTIVDTVLCLDGTQVIGTCLANELTKDGFANMNAHQTIYVITPEYTTGSQIILRDNLAPMVKGKHVLILAASITTGYTVQAAIEAIQLLRRHCGRPERHLRHRHRVPGIPVTSIFDPSNLPDYASFDSRECPSCKAGQHIDALVNQLRLFGAVAPCPIVSSTSRRHKDPAVIGSWVFSLFCFFREHKRVVQVDQHEVRRHEAPDDGLTEDDGVIGKLRDEEEHEYHLAHQLNDTGEEGQDRSAPGSAGRSGWPAGHPAPSRRARSRADTVRRFPAPQTRWSRR